MKKTNVGNKILILLGVLVAISVNTPKVNAETGTDILELDIIEEDIILEDGVLRYEPALEIKKSEDSEVIRDQQYYKDFYERVELSKVKTPYVLYSADIIDINDNNSIITLRLDEYDEYLYGKGLLEVNVYQDKVKLEHPIHDIDGDKLYLKLEPIKIDSDIKITINKIGGAEFTVKEFILKQSFYKYLNVSGFNNAFAYNELANTVPYELIERFEDFDLEKEGLDSLIEILQEEIKENERIELDSPDNSMNHETYKELVTKNPTKISYMHTNDNLYQKLFAKILRENKIATKVVYGYRTTDSGRGFTEHTWNEVYDKGNDEWHLIDLYNHSTGAERQEFKYMPQLVR